MQVSKKLRTFLLETDIEHVFILQLVQVKDHVVPMTVSLRWVTNVVMTMDVELRAIAMDKDRNVQPRPTNQTRLFAMKNMFATWGYVLMMVLIFSIYDNKLISLQECTGSICMAYGLESCQCKQGPNDPPEKLCELCCRMPSDDSTCKYDATL